MHDLLNRIDFGANADLAWDRLALFNAHGLFDKWYDLPVLLLFPADSNDLARRFS